MSFSYASRIIGPEGYGKVQFIVGFAQYFIIFAAFGIPILGVREIAKVKHDKQRLNKLFSELFILNIITSLVIASIYLGVIFSFDWFTEDINLYIIAGLFLLFSFSILEWFFTGMEQMHYLSIRSIIVKSIALIVLITFVKTEKDLITYFLIVIFSLIGNNLWNVIRLHKLVSIQFKNLNLKQHIPVLFTLFGTSLSISIYTVVDTILLGFLADEAAVGYYTASVRINKIMIPLIIALGTVLIPRITQALQQNNNRAIEQLSNQSLAFISILGIPIAFGLFLFAEEFLLSFSGDKFIMAATTMKIIAPLIILIGLGHLFGFQLLIPAGLQKKYFTATVWGMLASIILNVILIPLIKDKGTAIATLSGEIIVTSISFYFVMTKIKVKLNGKLILHSFLVSTLFIPIAYVLKTEMNHPILILGTGIISCTIVYFFIQIFILKNPYIKDILQLIMQRFAKKRYDSQRIST